MNAALQSHVRVAILQKVIQENKGYLKKSVVGDSLVHLAETDYTVAELPSQEVKYTELSSILQGSDDRQQEMTQIRSADSRGSLLDPVNSDLHSGHSWFAEMVQIAKQ